MPHDIQLVVDDLPLRCGTALPRELYPGHIGWVIGTTVPDLPGWLADG